MESSELEYVGFWPRVGASLIDTLLFCALILPLLIWLGIASANITWAAHYQLGGATTAHTGSSANVGLADWLQYLIYGAVVIGFWLYKQATPGKMLVRARVVDAKTGRAISKGQAIGRYLGYFVSSLPLCLGLIWVAFDSKKQGWHDKLAGTVVVRTKAVRPTTNPEPVTFT